MAKKVLLLVAIVCLLVPFMVLGTFASAESTSVSVTDGTVYFQSGMIVNGPTSIDDTSPKYWSGAPELPLTFPSLSLNVFDNAIIGAVNDYVTFSLTMFGANVQYQIANSFNFPSSDIGTRYITMYVGSQHTQYVFMLLNYVGSNSFTNTDVLRSFNLSGVTLSSLPNVFCLRGEYDSDDNYIPFLRSDIDLSYYPDFLSYVGGFNFTDVEVGVSSNQFFLVAFPLTIGNYTLYASSNYPSSLRILGLFKVYPSLSAYNDGYFAGYDVGLSAGYQSGLQAGLEQGNNEVTVGNASYNAGIQAGIQQADNRVNKNSFSYQQGLTDGRADGQDYTFLGLIGAVIDAPINALFGHTTADGVFHPGLFSIEILGMDMSAFILSIFTLSLIIAILRLCLGGK